MIGDDGAATAEHFGRGEKWLKITVAETGGGFVVATGGAVQARLELPLAGLLSTQPAADVCRQLQAVRGADVLLDHDPQCMNWISAYREPGASGGRGKRRRRRAPKA